MLVWRQWQAWQWRRHWIAEYALHFGIDDFARELFLPRRIQDLHQALLAYAVAHFLGIDPHGQFIGQELSYLLNGDAALSGRQLDHWISCYSGDLDRAECRTFERHVGIPVTLKLALEAAIERLAEAEHASPRQLVVQVRDDEVPRHRHFHVHWHVDFNYCFFFVRKSFLTNSSTDFVRFDQMLVYPEQNWLVVTARNRTILRLLACRSLRLHTLLWCELESPPPPPPRRFGYVQVATAVANVLMGNKSAQWRQVLLTATYFAQHIYNPTFDVHSTSAQCAATACRWLCVRSYLLLRTD